MALSSFTPGRIEYDATRGGIENPLSGFMG